jgi:hypothetical protein
VSDSDEFSLIVPYRMSTGAPLIPNEGAGRLMANWRLYDCPTQAEDRANEPEMPLIKLHQPAGRYRCLLSRLDPDDVHAAYGLADCGAGFPEIGYIRLDEIMSWRDAAGYTLERDEHFRPGASLFRYWEIWRDEALQFDAGGQLIIPGADSERAVKTMSPYSKRPDIYTAAVRS